MAALATTGLQALLFAPGPFYIYPWKAVINAVYGDNYETGLKHFITGHRHPVNLGLHTVALFLQLGGNFALLNHLDNTVIPQPIEGVRLLSAVSALSWIITLLPNPAPLIVRLASVATVAATYFAAPSITKDHYELFSVSAMMAAAAFFNYIVTDGKRKKRLPLKDIGKVFVIMPVWFLAWQFVSRNYAGAYAQHASVVQTAVLAIVGLLSLLPNPVKPVVIVGQLLCRTAGILTANPLLYWLGNAFVGSLFQGITHAVCREEATLLALERQGADAKLRFEYSHVVFFPNLLLHTIYKAIVG